MVIMGILNITPDSFSDGGMLGNTDTNGIFKPDMDKVLYRVNSMIKDGAGIIDVGGESTRPGYKAVETAEEIDRIAPVIENIKSRFDIRVSSDTNKSEVAVAAVNAGADIVNDIGGFTMDENMGATVASLDVSYVLTYNGYSADIGSEVKALIDRAFSYGIKKENLIIDPGIGFGKTASECLDTLKHLPELCKLDLPVLLGTSRKSFITPCLKELFEMVPKEYHREVLRYDNIRLQGTLLTSIWAAMNNIDYVRVHDVLENASIVRKVMYE